MRYPRGKVDLGGGGEARREVARSDAERRGEEVAKTKERVKRGSARGFRWRGAGSCTWGGATPRVVSSWRRGASCPQSFGWGAVANAVLDGSPRRCNGVVLARLRATVRKAT